MKTIFQPNKSRKGGDVMNFGKTVFLTKEAAEKALGGKEE
jgi:hypothetical protein